MTDTRRWSIVGLLCLGMMVAFVDRVTLSVALASPDFKSQFQLTDSMRGTLSSAFFWTYALLQIPGGMLVDRFGVKRPYGFSYMLWGVMAALTAMARNFSELLGLRLLLGVGEAVVTPASLKWIGMNLPEHRRGTAIGLLFAFAKLGPAIGSLVAAWLLQTSGWQAMFLIIGAGGLLWLIPWWILVPADKPEVQTAAAAAAAAKENDTQLRALFGTRLIWGVLTGTFCYNYFQYFCLTWLPSYLVEHRNLSSNSMGLYTAFSFGGMAVVATGAGWGADRMIAAGRDPALVRRGFTVAGFLIASTALIGGWSDSRTVALTFAIVSLSGLGLATANYWALTQTLLPGKAIGRIAGIQNMASNLAGIAAPVITGFLKEVTGSYLAAFQAVAFFMVLGLASYLLLVRRKYVPREFLSANAR